MLELAILGLLKDGPLHGYELKQRLASFGFWRVSFGSLYPALRRLERDEYISVSKTQARRKIFELTAEGKHHFQQLLENEPGGQDEERLFRVKLAFFRFLEPDSRLGVLEQRRAELTGHLAEARGRVRRAMERTRQRMDRYTFALMERGLHSVEAEIAWLDELIESERGSSLEPN